MPGAMELSTEEIRVLGCLVEKQMTTPDYYPMTQNSLQSACNQSTNRDPVVHFTDGTVIQALNDLRDHGLARAVHAPGQRAVKYRHVLDEKLEVDAREQALLAVLMLRGEQTAGELRARTGRYCDFSSPAEVVDVLSGLAARDEPLVVELERRPGEKEPRWRHLLGSGAAPPAPSPTGEEPASAAPASDAPAAGDIAELRAVVEDLQRRVTALEAAAPPPAPRDDPPPANLPRIG